MFLAHHECKVLLPSTKGCSVTFNRKSIGLLDRGACMCRWQDVTSQLTNAPNNVKGLPLSCPCSATHVQQQQILMQVGSSAFSASTQTRCCPEGPTLHWSRQLWHCNCKQILKCCSTVAKQMRSRSLETVHGKQVMGMHRLCISAILRLKQSLYLQYPMHSSHSQTQSVP